jgi:hypothetical protein
MTLEYPSDLNYNGNILKIKQLNKYKNKLTFHSSIKINTLTDIFYYALIINCGTYFSNGKHQCRPNKNRSLNDIYRLCKFYFLILIIIFIKK